MSVLGRRIFRALLAANLVAWLAIACLLLTGCAVAIPATVATSYVAGQVAAARMPDSIEQPTK